MNTLRRSPYSLARVRRFTSSPATRTTGRICTRRFRHADILRQSFDFIDYAVEDFPVRLIAVDTLSAGSNKGDFCPERARPFDRHDRCRAQQADCDFRAPSAICGSGGAGPDQFRDTGDDGEAASSHAALRDGLWPSSAAMFTARLLGHVGDIPATVVPCIATTLRRGEYPAHVKEMSGLRHLHRFDPLGASSPS